MDVITVFGRSIEALQRRTMGRRIVLEGDRLRLPPRETANLSLLLWELVINALQHGRGNVEILLTGNDRTCRLEVADAGPGFANSLDRSPDVSAGLALVDRIAAEELHGKVRFENRTAGGARVVVMFPVPRLPRLESGGASDDALRTRHPDPRPPRRPGTGEDQAA